MRRVAVIAALLPALALAQPYVAPHPGAGAFASVPAAMTTAALTLYVDPTGNDANACTASGTAACLTIPAATAKAPKRLRHPVIVNVAAGTYALGGALEGYSCEPGYSPTTGAYLQIVGALATATCATGSCTGTATSSSAQSGTTFALLTKTAAGWTVSDFRGKLLEITGGTGAGQLFQVYDNTATTISIAGAWATAPDATSTFAVRTWATTVSSGTTLPLNPVPEVTTAGAAVANYSAFIVDDIKGGATAASGGPFSSSGAASQGCVFLDRMKYTGRGVTVRGGRGVAVRFSDFSAAGSTGLNVYDGSVVQAQSNYAGPLNAGVPAFGMNYLAVPSALHLSGNVVDGGQLLDGAEGSSKNIGPAGSFYLRSNSVKNGASGNANVGIINLAGFTDLVSGFDHIETTASGSCVQLGVTNNYWGTSGSAFIQAGLFSSCSQDGVRLMGPVLLGGFNSGGSSIVGTGNGQYGLNVQNGARLRLNATTTVTGTAGDILLDGSAATYAQLPANTGLFGPHGSLVTANAVGDVAYTRAERIAAANLAASSATFAGAFAWDTTNLCLSVNNGSAWSCLSAGANFALGASSFSTAILNNTDLAASEINRAATLKSLRFTVAAAGTNGGGSTMIFSLCGAPGACATSYGSVTVNCTDPAGTVGVGTVTTAAIPAGTIANWRVTTDGCTLDPIGNMEASLTTP